MKTSTNRFIRRVAIFTIAVPTLSGTALTQRAIALEVVNDGVLAEQTGGVRYYTGACDRTNGVWNCNNADGGCHLAPGTDVNYPGDDYIDQLHAKPFCLGTQVNYVTGCNNHAVLYNTVIRTYYQRTAGQPCGTGPARAGTFAICTKHGC